MHDPCVDPLAPLLGQSLGRLLDVATGTGGFVRQLVDAGAPFSAVVGIDSNPARREAFEAGFGAHPEITFEVADARALAFTNGEFDTVAVSNSLHHFADPALVLAEMRRVLRPGGRLVINEMYRDGQTPEQMTHVELHHWWAAVNTRRGEIHRETLTRAGLLEIVADLDLAELSITESCDLGADPHEPGEIAGLEATIDQYLLMAGDDAALIARGQGLRQRLRTIGIHGATQLLAVGRVR